MGRQTTSARTKRVSLTGSSFGVTKLAQRTRGPQAAHVRKCASIMGGLPSPQTETATASDSGIAVDAMGAIGSGEGDIAPGHYIRRPDRPLLTPMVSLSLTLRGAGGDRGDSCCEPGRPVVRAPDRDTGSHLNLRQKQADCPCSPAAVISAGVTSKRPLTPTHNVTPDVRSCERSPTSFSEVRNAEFGLNFPRCDLIAARSRRTGWADANSPRHCSPARSR